MGAPAEFAYHRSVAPMLWVLAALSGIELATAHLLLAHWSRTAAIVLSAATLAGVGWLVGGITSMRRRPVLLDGERLLMRAGWLKRAEAPLADVAGLVEGWDGALVRARGTLNLALVAYPNVVVALRRPLPGRRKVVRLAHRLDDPAAFADALAAALARR